MTLLDRVRSSVGLGSSVEAPWARPADPRWRAVLAGALTAGIGWLALVLVASLVWAFTPSSTTAWSEVLGVGSGLWLLTSGSTVTVSGTPLGLVPLLAWGLQVWLGVVALGRARAAAPVWVAGVGLTVGYAAVAGPVALLSLLGPVRPTPAALPLVLTVPVLATVVALARDPDSLDRLPGWLRRAVAPARAGLLVLAALGALVVVGSLVARWDTVTGLHAASSAGLGGGIVLTVGQLLYAPNLAGWALAVLAGPGFGIGEGTHVSVSGTQGGLLPLVPALGGIPSDGHYPGWAAAALLLPVAVGLWLGRRASAQWTRLASWRHKARTAGSAVLLITLAVGLLALLGTGPAGTARLAHVGPAPLALALALGAELALGAALWLTGDAVRRRWLG